MREGQWVWRGNKLGRIVMGEMKNRHRLVYFPDSNHTSMVSEKDLTPIEPSFMYEIGHRIRFLIYNEEEQEGQVLHRKISENEAPTYIVKIEDYDWEVYEYEIFHDPEQRHRSIGAFIMFMDVPGMVVGRHERDRKEHLIIQGADMQIYIVESKEVVALGTQAP